MFRIFWDSWIVKKSYQCIWQAIHNFLNYLILFFNILYYLTGDLMNFYINFECLMKFVIFWLLFVILYVIHFFFGFFMPLVFVLSLVAKCDTAYSASIPFTSF